jgi:hypothetical protein
VEVEYDPLDAELLLETGVVAGGGGGGTAWDSAKALVKARAAIAVFHLNFISSPGKSLDLSMLLCARHKRLGAVLLKSDLLQLIKERFVADL